MAAPVVGARVASPGAGGFVYSRREPEKTALFQVIQQHLLTFEQQWTDKSDGHTLPSFVTDELHDFLGCGILARGLAQLFCPTCHERYVVGWSCKGRGFCPSCGGRRMNASALNVGFACSEATLRRKIVADVQKTLENMAWRGHLCSLQCKRINPRQAPRRCVEILLEASAEMGTNAVAASAVLTHGRFTSGGLTQV